MSSRKRITNYIKNVTGTGGGGALSGLISWGPNFGQSGDTHTTTARQIAPNQFELIFSNQFAASTQQISPNEFELIFSNQFANSTQQLDPTYQRTYTPGANAVAQSGGTTWASTGNATGRHNGSNATFAASLTAATAGQLNLSYADIPDYTTFGFTIVSAFLDFYTTQAGTVLSNGALVHKYDVGGSVITLATFTGNVTNAPASYDITAALVDQTTLNALTAHVSETQAVGSTVTATCDAVELRMVVTHA